MREAKGAEVFIVETKIHKEHRDERAEKNTSERELEKIFALLFCFLLHRVHELLFFLSVTASTQLRSAAAHVTRVQTSVAHGVLFAQPSEETLKTKTVATVRR